MTLDLISTQRDEVAAALLETGWRLAERQLPAEHWWLDELWTLESVWSPQGRRAYLIFLVDPQWDGPRRFGEGVWAVACCKTLPSDWMNVEVGATVPIRPRWERDRESLWPLLRQLHEV